MDEPKQWDVAGVPSAAAATPAATLDPPAFYSLYVGGLSLPDRTQRLHASAVILLSGRLGLRPVELQHLHEEWVDWGRGELVLPERDPCACQQCWEAARVAQRSGDGRRLSEIISETTWSPPGGGRTVPFGWSQRLTAIIATICKEEGYLDRSAEAMARLLNRSARRTEGIDHEAVDVRLLRSTAISFFADAGFPAGRIAALVGESPEVVRKFTKAEGGDARDHLFEQFDGGIADPGDSYGLVADPEPFDREPFDPRKFDAVWRQGRMRQRANEPERLRNPRPVADAVDGGLDGRDLGTRRSLDADSDLVDTDAAASRLRQWVRRREADRRGAAPPEATTASQPSATDASSTATDVSSTDTATSSTEAVEGSTAGHARPASIERTQQAQSPVGGNVSARQSGPSKSSTPPEGPAAGDPTGGADRSTEESAAVGEAAVFNPRDHLSGPPTLTVETTVACSDFADGRPTDARVFLGPGELLVVRDDDSMAPEYARIDLSAVVDQSVDYIPDGLASAFESAVTVAYEEGDDRRLAVVGLSGNQRIGFANAVFKTILSACRIVVTHPARKGGRVMRTDPVEGTLSVDDRSVSIETADEDDTEAFTIQLSDIIYFELEKQTFEEQRFRSLSVRHLNSASEAIKTTIAVRDDRKHKLFQRFVRRSYQERKQMISELTLTDEYKEVLVALYSAGDQFDISLIIDKPASELQELLRSLGQVGLVRMSDNGAVLTGLGHVVVNEKIEDVNV